MIVSVIIIGIAAGFSTLVGGKWAWIVFLSITLFLSIMLSIMGIYPRWLIIILLIAVAAIVTKIVIDLIKGE